MFERIGRWRNQWINEHRAQFQNLKTMGVMFKRSYLSIVGAIIIIILLLIGLIGPYIAPFDPIKQNLDLRLQAPAPRIGLIFLLIFGVVGCGIGSAFIMSKHNYSLPKEGRSRKTVLVLTVLIVIFTGLIIRQLQISASQGEYLLGIDQMGRDIFSRILHGARISIRIALITGIVTSILGLIVGLIAGYYGGKIDEILMRVSDMFIAFPRLVLAMALSAALGRGIDNVVIAISIAYWPVYARLVRGEVLVHKHKEYIDAIKAVGAPSRRIIFRHLLPLCITPIIVQATVDMGDIILVAAGLGFIGFGAQPPSPEWGLMVSDGRVRLQQAWWISTFPGLAILIVVLGFNLLGDGIRDILDPKMRR